MQDDVDSVLLIIVQKQENSKIDTLIPLFNYCAFTPRMFLLRLICLSWNLFKFYRYYYENMNCASSATWLRPH